ncbi:hypothetical protein L873DRAFT_1051969 [Choiromyces venosus 120613-1]|uniref:Glycosyl transferase CAP10 domain-containing protein n=1 Tax=Choiromyces venosus 120613-1 TaxID=1336337 RepID=A0A3N4JNV2_9PEZI|nr:hypothetical protein L873DRAFT_1051969 [Choiromyces venosus 120613-1]
MILPPSSRRRIFFVLSVLAFVIFVTNLIIITDTDYRNGIDILPIPQSLKGSGKHTKPPQLTIHEDKDDFSYSSEKADNHPISRLMAKAAADFKRYQDSRSKTFAQAIDKYRKKYGRHPPPGFDKWYRFARERNVYNIDDFDQIWDDLRPFWSIPPLELRKIVKGMLKENSQSGLSGITIVHGKIKVTNGSWRTDEFVKILNVFVKELPDMQIAMNKLDQPRVIVEWETLQEHLKIEEKNRDLDKPVTNGFSRNRELDESMSFPTAGWFGAPGKPYMDLASKACPPDSYARNNMTMDPAVAEAKYRYPKSGGLVSNFNISSDLCTVGPEIQDVHGMLFAPATIIATKKLVPVFGECKVNVNNDILFPANMYYRDDPRYSYNPDSDIPWDDKHTTVFWRGITSGGNQRLTTWRRLHRHRFVLLTNSTELRDQKVRLTLPTQNPTTTPPTYTDTKNWDPSPFSEKYTDVGFPELAWCVPDNKCGWLHSFLKEVNATSSLTDQFLNKYLPDIDGHSFSGRWHAWLKSRSLGIKATIFREWHDSRLFAWQHFVPMDNRFDDFYTIITYFIGLGNRLGGGGGAYIPTHDSAGKRLAGQGREWAAKVLRKEDIEVYMFRLMLEYARLLDDRREMIGYGGSGRKFKEEKKWVWPE